MAKSTKIVSNQITTKKLRIDQLDGLRGLAIILVVLNHLRWGPLFDALPTFLRPFLGALVGSGKTGVLILFLLSGFLMATLYPVLDTKAAKVQFWLKRYLRIFPAFIGMCIALFTVRQLWDALPSWAVAMVVGLIVMAGGLLWRRIQNWPPIFGERNLIKIFWGVQSLVAVGYIGLQFFVPAAVFYQLWPAWASQLVFFLTNLTMTLPLGVYAPQLDGVYWSVIAEVLFYWLYPTIVLPILHIIFNRVKGVWAWFFAVVALPFFYAIGLLFKTVLGLGMLEMYMMSYFVLGVVAGKVYSQPVWRTKIALFNKVPAVVAILLGVGGVWGLGIAQNFLSVDQILGTLAWLVPLGLVFCLTLAPNNSWSRLLQTAMLRKLGQVSYALYLTHTVAIEMWVKDGSPTTLQAMLWAIGLAVLTMTLLTALVHNFLEVPYFTRQKALLAKKNSEEKSPRTISAVSSSLGQTWAFFTSIFSSPIVVVILVVLGLTWYGFRAPVSLASLVVNHHDEQVGSRTVLSTDPIKLRFTASTNNIGMLLLHLESLSDGEVVAAGLTRGDAADGAVKVVVTDQDGNVVTTKEFPLYQLFNARFHPVGLPLLTDSAGKTYEMEVSLTTNDSSQKIALIQKSAVFKTVAVFGKQEVLANPGLAIQIGWNKLTQPFAEQEAQHILLLAAPLLIGLTSLNRKFTRQT